MTIDVGSKAPDFSMPTDDGGQLSLSDLNGKKVVLYFYPKDDTPGCTKEGAAFRDLKADFDAIGAVIVGVSKDSVESHEKFKKKMAFNFTLASDSDGKVVEAYNVWKERSMYGKKFMGIERSTFLIDGEGTIRNVWRKVKVDGHAEAVLEAAKAI